MKNYYIALGLIFGAGLGISIGVLTNNLPVYLSVFSGAGIALGAGLENYAKAKKRDCEVKKD